MVYVLQVVAGGVAASSALAAGAAVAGDVLAVAAHVDAPVAAVAAVVAAVVVAVVVAAGAATAAAVAAVAAAAAVAVADMAAGVSADAAAAAVSVAAAGDLAHWAGRAPLAPVVVAQPRHVNGQPSGTMSASWLALQSATGPEGSVTGQNEVCLDGNAADCSAAGLKRDGGQRCTAKAATTRSMTHTFCGTYNPRNTRPRPKLLLMPPATCCCRWCIIIAICSL